MQKLSLFPNPYAHLDHEGRLAGACPMGESLRAITVLPSRRYIGARIEQLRYEKRPAGTGQQSRASLRFVFGVEPVEVSFTDPMLEAFYGHRMRTREVLAAGPKQLDELAAARVKAIAEWRANYGADPPAMSDWAKQFPLDEAVAKHADESAKKPAPKTTQAQSASKGD
jgi:hypothetical protein